MKPLLIALLLVGAPLVRGADVPTTTFYVQLIHGSDEDAPPTPQAHLIRSKLDHRLHDIFKWKNYWEMKCETITLKTGAKARKRITPQREIEITWPDPKDMTISIYADGKLTRKRQQSIDASFYIAGGDKEGSESWFIVVCRDDPDAGQDAGTKLAATP